MPFFTEYIFNSHHSQISHLKTIKNKSILYITYRSFPIFSLIEKEEEINIFTYEKYKKYFLLFIFSAEEFFLLPSILDNFIEEKKIDLVIFDNFMNFFYGKSFDVQFLHQLKEIAHNRNIAVYFYNREQFPVFLAYEMNKIVN